MEHTKFIITINRECGSGGGEIARKLGDILEVPVYSKLALKSVAKKYNLTEVELEQIKAKIDSMSVDVENIGKEDKGKK